MTLDTVELRKEYEDPYHLLVTSDVNISRAMTTFYLTQTLVEFLD